MTAEDPNPKPEKALVFVLDEVKDEPEGQGQDGKSKKRNRKSAGFQQSKVSFKDRDWMALQAGFFNKGWGTFSCFRAPK